ncbi:MAG: 8-amino-7-oxononanoate synthase [Candidatus Omnitrophota bacterium]
MEQIEKFLQQQEQRQLLRGLCPADARGDGKIYFNGKEYIDFSSNDYLGLSNHPKIKQAVLKAVDKFGGSSSASRLLSGDLKLHHQLEEQTADFKGKEAALIFNSGYQANVGVISALYQKGDVIFSDKLNHASIVDGIGLSGARFFRFLHNDITHLKTLLKKERNKFKNALIITETIFSMDGDRAPVTDIVRLKEKYHCQIFVDEAHATGIFGKNGAGVVEEEGMTGDIDIIMGTFSKALGSFGAYVAVSNKIKKYLINTCRSFIYSTALPPAVISANLESINLIKQEPQRRKILLKNAGFFRTMLQHKGVSITGGSQIVPLILRENIKAMEYSKKLKDAGYWVVAIRPPTVPEGAARIRFSLTYNHTKEMLEKVACCI